MEKLDREDLVVRDRSETRGNSEKLKKSACRKDIKKYSFPTRSIGTWNELDEETVCAKKNNNNNLKPNWTISVIKTGQHKPRAPAKMEMLGVRAQTLEENGAVSEPVVVEMVQGALEHSNATIGVSISGIAGPGGGSAEKPVGTVCFAFADKQDWLLVETMHFDGDRAQIREQAVFHALSRFHQHLAEKI